MHEIEIRAKEIDGDKITEVKLSQKQIKIQYDSISNLIVTIEDLIISP